MSKNVYFCSPSMNVAEAVAMMWTDDCGALPVVNESGNVVGMITDRDICMALGTREVNAGTLRVGDVFVPRLFSCEPGDDIHQALVLCPTNNWTFKWGCFIINHAPPNTHAGRV
jgi:CBS domain-containing protein